MAAFNWRKLLAHTLPLAAPALLISALVAEEQLPRQGLDEPVYKVTRKEGLAVTEKPGVPAAAAHPLDPAIAIAHDALAHIQKDIADYTCTLVKRERIGNDLSEHQYMFLKVRNRKTENGQLTAPLSAYMYFMKPKGMEGREVIWVEGRNGGKLTAHEGGKVLGLVTVDLEPTSSLAMRGQRYPITEIGIENLVAKLIEKGERDKQIGTCEVKFVNGAKINGRVCTCLQVTHPQANGTYDFHIARIFIDDEMKVPVRYEAYDWPKEKDGKPELLEEYTYLNLQLNVGLTDLDFDKTNPKYNFRGFGAR